MIFFNKTEHAYLEDFSTKHKNLKSTYFSYYQSTDEFLKKVKEDAFKYSYFILIGTLDFINSAYSLYKLIQSIVTFSFEGLKRNVVNSSGYFAAGMCKYGFSLLSICFDLVQQLSKSVCTIFYALGLCGRDSKIKCDSNSEIDSTLRPVNTIS